MFRKTILALTAAGALGAIALAPTSASAWGWKGGWGHSYGWGLGGVGLVGYDSCLQKRWVDTRVGPRLRWVNVCVY